MSGLWWLRWVIVALGTALGLVLVFSGRWLIGVLVLALALARAAFLVGARRRRAAYRERRRRFGPPGRFDPPGAP